MPYTVGMEREKKKKKKSGDDEFRWSPEELDMDIESELAPETEPGLEVNHFDFISSEGPLRLVVVIDAVGDVVQREYQAPPEDAPICVEWRIRQVAKGAFSLVNQE
jgi:hypothetical protein